MKIRFDNKLMISIIGLVYVIFMAAMALMYRAEKEKILFDELKDEKKELCHIAEIGNSLLDSVMTHEQVEKLLESPWNDGSDKGAYNLVPADSVEIIKSKLEKANPKDYIITAKLKETDDSPVLIKILTQEKFMAPIGHTLSYAVYTTIFFLLILAAAIFIAIRFHTRSELALQKRINSELDIAKRIQAQMLPKNPAAIGDGKNVEVGSMIRPAKEIGGDYYNVFRLGNYLHFIIADVSGKGIPAALFMARVADIYSMSASEGNSPAKVAEEINGRLCLNNSTCMFATATIGRINLENNTLEICRAGHEQPLLVPEQGEPSFMSIDGNLPLGLMPNHNYTMLATALAPNSHLLLFTDGVTEAEDASLRQFGAKNLVDAAASYKNASPKELIDEIIVRIRAFTGSHEQSDDIAILDIKTLTSASTQSIRLDCNINELEKLLAFADSLQLNNKVMLAIEEAAVNVFNYSSASFLEALVERHDDATIVRITDNGMPFDPTSWHKGNKKPQTNSDGFLTVGGEGINLIMRLMDEVKYSRTDDKNVLTIKYKAKQ